MSRSIVRRSPLDEFFAPIESVLGRGFMEPMSVLQNPIDEGTLALDVSEDDKNVYVHASLPGFHREDVSVEVHDGVLTISASRTEEHETKEARYYRRERHVGSVSRRLALPTTVAESGAQAELKDGVLTLTLPKIERNKAKRINVK